MWLCKRDLSRECEGEYRDCTDCVLDKIRSEIMRLDYDLDTVEYDHDDMAHSDMIHTICREEVLQIIDKYIAEGSDKE